MKHLTLIRHAKSSTGNFSSGDFGRPLGDRGLLDAPRIGASLAKHHFGNRKRPSPDVIVSSPALRAITTAEIIAREIDFPESSIRLEPRIYESSCSRLFSLIQQFDREIAHLVLVGHNPGFEQLALTLHPNFKGDGEKYPTCGVALMELAIGTWEDLASGCSTHMDFIYPKMLA